MLMARRHVCTLAAALSAAAAGIARGGGDTPTPAPPENARARAEERCRETERRALACEGGPEVCEPLYEAAEEAENEARMFEPDPDWARVSPQW